MLILRIKLDDGTERIISETFASKFISSLTTVEDTFQLQFDYVNEESFKIGQECTLYQDDKLVLTGYITAINLSSDGTLTVVGASKTWLLTKSSIPHTEQGGLGTLATVKSIIDRICSWVGISVLYDVEEIKNLPANYIVAEQDHALIDTILEITNQNGLYISTDNQGRLVIAYEVFDFDQTTNPFILNRIDITKYDINFVEGNRGKFYRTESLRTFGFLWEAAEDIISTAAEINGTCPLELHINSLIEADDSSSDLPTDQWPVTFKNNQIASVRENSTISVSIEMQQDLPFVVGDVLEIDFPEFKLTTGKQFLIETLEFESNMNESKTFYQLASIDKYNSGYVEVMRSDWVKYRKI